MRAIARLTLIAGASAIAFSVATSGSANAEKRVALVIGNSAYVNVPRLDNPKNDARLMADTLRALGFTLVGGEAQLDLDKPAIDRVVQEFGSNLQGADVGLFYYAGHGVQVSGANYLVPIAANPTRESDVDFQMLDTNLVLRQMVDAGTKLNLVILDACRNNPFGGRGLRATDSGLGQMRAPEGTLISFATQPGNVAKDGADGHSPYTKALAQVMRKPGLDVFRTFNEVGLAVVSETGGAQQPWFSLSPIKGDFYFTGALEDGTDTRPSKDSAAPARLEKSNKSDVDVSQPAVSHNYRVLDNVSEGVLNLRGGPGVNYSIVVPIPAGAADLKVGRCQVPDDGTGAGWCEVQWRGNSGWVSGRYIAEVNARRTFRVLDNVSEGVLNLRSGPGVNYSIVVPIPAGAADLNVGRCQVPDDGTGAAWCEVQWRGKSGWVSSRYIVDNVTGQFARTRQ